MAAEKPSTMKAVQYDTYGGGAAGLKHVEVPIPSPKKNEVLLKLEAAALNPIDWKIQKGMLRPFLPPRFPFTPVCDAAGEVVEVGSWVNSIKKGDKVVGINFKNGGGLAEFAVITMGAMAIIPPEVSPSEAVGLSMAGLTALQALQALKAIGVKFDTPNKSSNILITAASGGVGHYAVQLAKYSGLHVTATCGARNIELVKSLGADEVVDYKTPEGAKLKSPSDKKYDGVIHCATNIPWSTFEPNLSSSGKVIDITPDYTRIATSILKTITNTKNKLIPLYMVPKSSDLQFLLNLVKEGKLKTVIDSAYPLSKAEEAWAKGISGHGTGKIIIEI
ncbi:chloroplast envelope quinone oxidoreductase homolog [Zingiber officinale]|uniref:chloroplast envelope quinone oxidoreductase homolog n=1 Tax=Zingiber officinale TaxID=94328 RepID=UPI001C4C2205|nr:chloroplast envelope quinone oxidoreductase homolog [Zingiber officinale]